MKTREFIKSIGMGLVGLVTFGKAEAKPEVPKFTFKEPPPPLERSMCFEYCGLFFEFFATTNILIPVNDWEGKLVYDINVYCEYAKIVGTARDSGKMTSLIVRLEGDLLRRDEIDSKWNEQVSKLVTIGCLKFKDHAVTLNKIPNKLSLS